MKHYITPELSEFGSIATLTAAVGGDSKDDQSEFPDEFPPNTGSFDVCDNENPTEPC